ncbi:1753_t:CDS:2 [Funneliformis geosporum]|uniref:1753_t:CDS:1 n=1 Tax=Funneliformis geosporum TaxID=1117311 RepID=A0A9W4SKF7_9GLOM|nr:1753_t:CDS:2 [Funneliformis geosporum]
MDEVDPFSNVSIPTYRILSNSTIENLTSPFYSEAYENKENMHADHSIPQFKSLTPKFANFD